MLKRELLSMITLFNILNNASLNNSFWIMKYYYYFGISLRDDYKELYKKEKVTNMDKLFK